GRDAARRGESSPDDDAAPRHDPFHDLVRSGDHAPDGPDAALPASHDDRADDDGAADDHRTAAHHDSSSADDGAAAHDAAHHAADDDRHAAVRVDHGHDALRRGISPR